MAVTAKAKPVKKTRGWRSDPIICAAIVQDYEAKMPQKDILAKHGIASSSLASILRAANVSRRHRDADPQRTELECPHCGDFFIPTGKDQTCCSRDCALDMQRDWRRKRGELIICVECGYEMMAEDDMANGMLPFCSPRCRREHKIRKDGELSVEIRGLLTKGLSVSGAALKVGVVPHTASLLLKNYCAYCGSRLLKGGGRKRCVRCLGGERQPVGANESCGS